MSPYRWLLAGALCLFLIGSFSVTIGSAVYLRSAAYRRACEAHVTRALGMPTEIAGVTPRAWRVREFHDVRVWLPERRQVALTCALVRLTHTPAPHLPDAYELRLLGGSGELSTRTWLREDFRFVLEHGLRPGFDPTGPRRVLFSGLNLSFERDRFQLRLDDATGVVTFEDPQLGRATAECRRFNGHETVEPVRLTAAFSPSNSGIRLDAVELRIPRLPLAVLGLAELAGLELRSGALDGRIEYREGPEGHGATLSGACFDVSLAEISAAFVQPPWRGQCRELELVEFTVLNRMPQRIRLRGVLQDVRIGDLLAPLGLADVRGVADLRVRTLELSPTGIERLSASGRCALLSLAAVSDALGWGRMTGEAELILDDVSITHNTLTALDASIRVLPDGAEGPNWIEGRLLREVIRRTIGIALPPLLPERIEYTQAGLRLEVRDEQLYLYGSHGEREQVILTVRIAGQELALIRETQTTYPLTPWLDQLRAQAAAQAQQRWEQLAPLTQPAARPARGADGGVP